MAPDPADPAAPGGGPRDRGRPSVALSEGYVPGGIGRIAELHGAYYARASGFGVAFEAQVAGELSDFCLRYQAGRDGLFLARDERVIQGSVIVDASAAATEGAHLRWFIVSDAIRGQGVGRRLLARAVEFADARRYRRLFLWTFAGLDAACHLYEAHGFRLVHQAAGTRWGTVVQEQRFERLA